MTAMTHNSEVQERSESDIRKRHAEMLEAALARPGIREVMKVYGAWKESDRGLDPYRAATGHPAHGTTTNTSNPS